MQATNSTQNTCLYNHCEKQVWELGKCKKHFWNPPRGGAFRGVGNGTPKNNEIGQETLRKFYTPNKIEKEVKKEDKPKCNVCQKKPAKVRGACRACYYRKQRRELRDSRLSVGELESKARRKTDKLCEANKWQWCSLDFDDCLGSNHLPAYRHEKGWYEGRNPRLLWDIRQWVPACKKCNAILNEHFRHEQRERVFRKLRGEELLY